MEKDTYFYEAFKHMERLGPGSVKSTLQAAALYPAPRQSFKILDIGCGLGAHTFLLAEQFSGADITAIDTNATYIERLNQTARQRGLTQRVRGVVMSMFNMTFPKESFDLIWSEGAIYIAGFEKGIKAWKRLLKPEGYLVCSELSWLKETPSIESAHFWNEAYPSIDTVDHKRGQIEAAGYAFQESFICPETDWMENYYVPLQKNLDAMKERGADNPDILEVAEALQLEIDVYRRHSDDYSYVFYVMKKI